MIDRKTVCVLGAGITGLSTSALLLKMGYSVHIITRDDPRKSSAKPDFSSLYPAASVIPHCVHSDQLIEIFKSSKSYFEDLRAEGFPGIDITEHYELFSIEKEPPEYAYEMDNFEVLDEFKDEFYPKHPEHNVINGWRFNTFLADWPVYFPALINSVLDKVSGFEIRELTVSDLSTLPFDVIINCTEIGSIELFNDRSNRLIHRGHLLNIPGAPPIKNRDGNIISYNFTPGEDIYRSETGGLQDVYCYSRQNDIVLGGSRQRGYISDQGVWKGETNMEPVTRVNGLEVPSQILDLHKDILKHTFGYKLPPVTKMRSKLGYRFTRDDKSGLRIECEEIENKLVIHNYGHGGAGVTLSWGCARKVVELLQSASN